MGFRVLLIAVQGKSKDKLFDEYSVKNTGRLEEVPESNVLFADLDDYLLLYVNDQIEPQDELLKSISIEATLIALYANETSMISYATKWGNGVQIWEVLHNSQLGVLHRDYNGRLPESFQKIEAKQLKKQKDTNSVDYIFNVPVELFFEIVGFRYDKEYKKMIEWEVLERMIISNSWWNKFKLF